ncbi:hypothetical protein [Sandarakinorhabdus sp.]|uniref:hypothetical protein n=1 Tax=Sandarakinorhabdus sp. TaxID=1916663 RepID=UPI00334144FC
MTVAVPRRRWPLLLAVLPLLLGLAVYGQLWRGWAAEFETTLADWFPSRRPAVSGFPYRLETTVDAPMLVHEGTVQLRFIADRLRLNRGPWRPELTVMQSEWLKLSAILPGLSPRVQAPAGTASLKLDRDDQGQMRLARLSIVLPNAVGSTGLGPTFQADRLELHGRELEPVAAPPASDPRLPQRGQVVIGAEGLRFGRRGEQGTAISMTGEAKLRAAGRLRDWAAWAAGGGSIDLVLSGRDATGELFALDASIVPLGAGLRLAGTIRTVCPLAVQAALNGTKAAPELRLRAPVQLSLQTYLPTANAPIVQGLPANLAGRPRRAQLPPCPRLA